MVKMSTNYAKPRTVLYTNYTYNACCPQGNICKLNFFPAHKLKNWNHQSYCFIQNKQWSPKSLMDTASETEKEVMSNNNLPNRNDLDSSK